MSTGELLPDDVSALLLAWTDGDQHALARLTPITVMREWTSAKAWLYRELASPTANGQ